jgi:predicted ATPase
MSFGSIHTKMRPLSLACRAFASEGCTALVPYRRRPSELYAASVCSGAISTDPAQLDVLPSLDRIYEALPGHVHLVQLHETKVEELREQRMTLLESEKLRLSRIDAERGALSRAWHDRFGKAPEVALRFYEQELVRREPNPEPPMAPRGLYLHGAVGFGKTMLMDMLFSSVRTTGIYAARVHFQTFMIAVYEGLHVYDCMSEQERYLAGFDHPLDAVLNYMFSADRGVGLQGGLVCFDEFQMPDVADAQLIQGVFQRLLFRGFVLTITSNRALEEIDRSQLRFNQEFRGFLNYMREKCETCELASGLDYREEMHLAHKASQKAPRYIFSAKTPEQTLLRRWKEDAGSAWDEVISLILPVALGREFVVRRASPSLQAAQFESRELLEDAVGPADFVALARQFHVLYITDVLPPFTFQNRDSVRRWIWLVDAFYAERRRLVVRTASGQVDDMLQFDAAFGGIGEVATAEGVQFETEVARQGVGATNRDVGLSSSLYTAEDERFALQRAVSRLKAMQTDAYASSTTY